MKITLLAFLIVGSVMLLVGSAAWIGETSVKQRESEKEKFLISQEGATIRWMREVDGDLIISTDKGPIKIHAGKYSLLINDEHRI